MCLAKPGVLMLTHQTRRKMHAYGNCSCAACCLFTCVDGCLCLCDWTCFQCSYSGAQCVWDHRYYTLACISFDVVLRMIPNGQFWAVSLEASNYPSFGVISKMKLIRIGKLSVLWFQTALIKKEDYLYAQTLTLLFLKTSC